MTKTQQHTPGPWKYERIGNGIKIMNAGGYVLTSTNDGLAYEKAHAANAARIVTCVNFLEGDLTTNEINAGAMKYGQLNRLHSEAIAERDALRGQVAALREALQSTIDVNERRAADHRLIAMAIARAALAATEPK